VTPVSLVVLCEGLAEQRFTGQVIRPHLRGFGVFAKGQLLTPGGGVVKFRGLRDSVSMVLGTDGHTRVTTMLDLYRLPRDYPGWEPRAGETGTVRAARIETAMRGEVPEPRFLPYLQVHEFEALVLSDLDALAAHFPKDGQSAAGRLRKSMANTAPEDINLGQDTAPSKRILAAIPGYAKAVDGPAITARIGMAQLCQRCPHFAQWVDSLERLSQRSGSGR